MNGLGYTQPGGCHQTEQVSSVFGRTLPGGPSLRAAACSTRSKPNSTPPGAAGVRLQVWLVRALLLLVRERLRADESAEGSGNRLMESFRQLVEAHYAEHWPVETYAAALKLTESRLNRLSRKLSGQTAFALTQERLLLEARRKLIYTATPVSQLPYELGFSDPAYFCRFFKKLTGRAPSSFRAASAGRTRQWSSTKPDFEFGQNFRLTVVVIPYKLWRQFHPN
jgi:AraC-like DNA-binding protein